MYIEPNTIIKIYSGIPLDNTYVNTLYFSSLSEQSNYFHGLNTNLKHTLTSQTYQRVNRGAMRVAIPSESLYECNYLAFQNSSYGSKWFYAFITSVEYVNNETSLITFEIDVMQTYLFDVTLLMSFVEREHSSIDVIGHNRMPEPIDVGDYVCVDNIDIDASPTSLMIQLSEKINSETGKYETPDFIINSDGIPQCLYRGGTRLDNPTGLATLQLLYEKYVTDGKADDLISIQTYPDFSEDNITVKVLHPTTLENYLPKNNKLLQYPYCKLVVTNNRDNTGEFAFEDFAGGDGIFTFKACTTGTPQVITLPNNYRGLDVSYDSGILMTDYPQVPCGADSYIQAIGNNALSMGLSVLNASLSVSSAIVGAGTSNMMANTPNASGKVSPTASLQGDRAIASGGYSVGGTVLNTAGDIANTFYQASRLPDRMHGNSGGNYLAMHSGAFKFRYLTKTIRTDMAIRIDDFFSRYGYATNELKIPNRYARENWTYTKTKGCNVRGNAPTDDIRKICTIYDNGITFWVNPSSVGDYSLSNAPLQQGEEE